MHIASRTTVTVRASRGLALIAAAVFLLPLLLAVPGCNSDGGFDNDPEAIFQPERDTDSDTPVIDQIEEPWDRQ